MHPPSPQADPLKAEFAFVVQLRSAYAPCPEDLSGRVEHIATGQMARFDSMAELFAFMCKSVGEVN